MGVNIALIVCGWLLLLWSRTPGRLTTWFGHWAVDGLQGIGWALSGVTSVTLVLDLTKHESAWLRMVWIAVGFMLIGIANVIALVGPRAVVNGMLRRRPPEAGVAHHPPSKTRFSH